MGYLIRAGGLFFFFCLSRIRLDWLDPLFRPSFTISTMPKEDDGMIIAKRRPPVAGTSLFFAAQLGGATLPVDVEVSSPPNC